MPDKIRSVLTTEVKLIIGIVVFAVGIVAPFYTMKTDIALIKQNIETINTNHLAHMQDLEQQIKDMQADQKVQNDKIEQNQMAIIKLLK